MGDRKERKPVKVVKGKKKRTADFQVGFPLGGARASCQSRRAGTTRSSISTIRKGSPDGGKGEKKKNTTVSAKG